MDVRVSLISSVLSSIKTYLFHYFKANEVLRIKFADIRRELGEAGREYSPPIGLFSDLVSSHYQNSALYTGTGREGDRVDQTDSTYQLK